MYVVSPENLLQLIHKCKNGNTIISELYSRVPFALMSVILTRKSEVYFDIHIHSSSDAKLISVLVTVLERDFIAVTLVMGSGRDSSVGVTTRYGLEVPGIESRWRQDVPHPSRPSLLYIGYRVFPGGK
jgi:hypothetical protein